MSEIRDPIYGFITPNETEFRIIDSSIFQRLHKIRQLAMEYLVYPGAKHTRFDHSLGVYHIASLMADKLLPKKEDEEKKRIIRLSALVHDIGHGPFSHISEEILGKYSDSNKGEELHEKMTARLIENNPELDKLLSSEDKKNIIGLLSGKHVTVSLMKEIVSGPLDADKIDYLQRDSYFCGVKYGVFDIHRMLNTLTTDDDNIDQHIAVAHDGINTLEQFVLAKYYMITQVYRHKVRSVSDEMIKRGIELGIEHDGIKFLKNLYCYKDTEEYLNNFLNYWDDKVVSEIVSLAGNGYAKEIFTRLYQRRLFKRIFSKKLKEIEIKDEKLKDRIINISSRENEKLKKELEEQIAESNLLKCGKEYVIVNCFTKKSVRELSRDSEGGIIIIDANGNKKNFEDESLIFNSINESLTDAYFEVYAPFEYGDRRDKIIKVEQITTEISALLREKEV